MFLSLGLFICLAVHFTATYLARKRLGPTQVWLSQLAGPVAAYLVAALFFFTALQLVGASVPTTSIVVLPDKPASRAGLQSGDRVLMIAGNAVSSWDEVKARLSSAPREASTVVVAERHGQSITVQVTPDAGGRIGIVPQEEHQQRAWQSSLGPALAAPILEPLGVLQGLWGLLSDRPVTLGGPIGILHSTGSGLPVWKALFVLLAPSMAVAWPATVLAALVTIPRNRALAARS
ncbi:MAG TPA: M50 family metallopeptidase [Polyangiaceae bacterium]|jgi:membrane-associated protease RseP (regulator of RpoE activity)